MKASSDAILRSAQAAYLERLLAPRDALLREIEEVAAREQVPISDPEVGQMLRLLVRATGAARVLEIGSAIGYGTLWMARGSDRTKITCLERRPDRIAIARSYLERASVADRVEFLCGEALELTRDLEPPFHLVYLDCDKRDYRRLLDFSLQLMPVGGLLVIDNLLWKGQVAEPPDEIDDEEEQAEVLRAFNGYFMMHPQLDALLLPVGDGLGLAAKTKPLVTDLGGPY